MLHWDQHFGTKLSKRSLSGWVTDRQNFFVVKRKNQGIMWIENFPFEGHRVESLSKFHGIPVKNRKKTWIYYFFRFLSTMGFDIEEINYTWCTITTLKRKAVRQFQRGCEDITKNPFSFLVQESHIRTLKDGEVRGRRNKKREAIESQ